MYGSSLRWVTRTPREARIAASEAAAMPFPNEETTPPVTNTNLGMGDQVPEIRILQDSLRTATSRSRSCDSGGRGCCLRVTARK